MTSREIADLTGKRHPDVTRDIEKMLVDLQEDVSSFAHIYFDGMNRSQQEYRLDRELTETLLTGYSAILRRKVIARWRELEEKTTRQLSPAEMFLQNAQAMVDMERRQQARDQEVALISSRIDIVEQTQLLKERPQNAESITHIRPRIGKRFGVPSRIVDEVIRQSPYSPRPAGMVRNDRAEAEGASYAVYWTKDINAVFKRFVDECKQKTPSFYTHPFINGPFRLFDVNKQESE